MDVKKVRGEFPLLKHTIYLNSADQAPPARYWIEAIKECLLLYEAGEIEDVPPYGAATHPFLSTAFFESIEKGARLIHARKDEVTNSYRIMTAANIIINDVLKWERGDNVVFTDLDYPSIPFILLGLKREGVELRRVSHRNGIIHSDDVEKAVDDRTKLVVMNRTLPWSGFTYNAEEISEIAHEHGAYVLDDAFQAVGAVDVDVHRDNVDFLLTGSYKWQCGPEGAGILYIRYDVIEELEPRFRNYLWADFRGDIPFSRREHDNLRDWDYPLRNDASKFDTGCTVTPILFGWNATLDFLLNLGMDAVETGVRNLGDYAFTRLMEEGFIVHTPEDRKHRHGLIVYTSGNYKMDMQIYQKLMAPDDPADKPVKVTLRYVGGIGGIRISTHFFNTRDEVDALIERQKRIMKTVR